MPSDVSAFDTLMLQFAAHSGKSNASGRHAQLLASLRELIISDGLPLDAENVSAPAVLQNTTGQQLSLRGAVWLALLGFYDPCAAERTSPEAAVDAAVCLLPRTAGHARSLRQFGATVGRGPSKFKDKIEDDAFRTFRSDAAFKRAVPIARLSRVLNAAAHLIDDHDPSRFGYIQGMNAMCGCFLRNMPDHEALRCLLRMITRLCPTYVASGLPGAHTGAALVGELLSNVDPELQAHLVKGSATAAVWAFAPVLSLSASMPPLSETFRVWDVLLALGVHLNVIFTAAHTLLQRDAIMADPRPIRIVSPRKPTPLSAPPLVSLVMRLLADPDLGLDDGLYTRIAAHTQTL